MSAKIRLKRIGAKKKPIYKIVVINDKSSRDGRVIEDLGTYDPNKTPEMIKLNKERAKYWLGCGAVTSQTAGSILRKKIK